MKPNPLKEHWKPGDVFYTSGIDFNGCCYLFRGTLTHLYDVGEGCRYIVDGREDFGERVSTQGETKLFKTRAEATRHLEGLVLARTGELETERQRLVAHYAKTILEGGAK